MKLFNKSKLLLLISMFTILIVSGTTVKAMQEIKSKEDQTNLLVYSFNKKVYTFNIENKTIETIGDWESVYDYEILSDELISAKGGKKHKRDTLLTPDPNAYAEEYVHTILQSPFDSSQKIVLESNDLKNTFKIGFRSNNEYSWELTNDKLIEAALLVPVLWLDTNTILLGSGSLEDLSYYKFYTFDLSSFEIKEFTDLPRERIYDVLEISKDIYLIRGEDQQIKIWDSNKKEYTEIFDIKAQYIWGWTKGNKINQFRKNLKRFNEDKKGKSRSGSFNLIKKVKAQTSTAFLYWPVPSNHDVICEISCYGDHVGIDITTNTDNSTPIVAAASGKVVSIQNDQPFGDNRVTSPGSGNYVKLQHSANGTTYYTAYLHLASNLTVTLNQDVVAGEILGYGSNSGYTCGDQPVNTGGCLDYSGAFHHLHFEVQGSCGNSSCWIDPYDSSLWHINTNGYIQDPPSSVCAQATVVIENKTVNLGQTFNCSATTLIKVKPGSLFKEGSNVRLFIY